LDLEYLEQSEFGLRILEPSEFELRIFRTK